MAIHVLRPNQIGTEAEAMFNVTEGSGRELIESFSTSINSMKSHWRGTDALANLTDLSKVYTEVTELVKTLQKLIVSVNNDEVVPLQQHIVASGGTCTVGSELSASLNVDSFIDIPDTGEESWTDNAIITDAEIFNDFPTTFERFVEELIAAKDTLLDNWKEGAQRDEVVNLFNEFENNVGTYKSQLEKVRNNLNQVAENKKKFI